MRSFGTRCAYIGQLEATIACKVSFMDYEMLYNKRGSNLKEKKEAWAA